jgi:hypothetical protein
MNEKLDPEGAEIIAGIINRSQQDTRNIAKYCEKNRIGEQDKVALDMMHSFYRAFLDIPDKGIIDEMFSEKGESDLEVEVSLSGIWGEVKAKLNRDSAYRERMIQLYLNMVREILPSSD